MSLGASSLETTINKTSEDFDLSNICDFRIEDEEIEETSELYCRLGINRFILENPNAGDEDIENQRQLLKQAFIRNFLIDKREDNSL